MPVEDTRQTPDPTFQTEFCELCIAPAEDTIEIKINRFTYTACARCVARLKESNLEQNTR